MRERLRTIELSRFWRARNRFFALKRRLGFGEDGAWDTFEIPAAYSAWLDESDPYAEWRVRHDPRPADLARMRAAADALAVRTRFEITIEGGDGAQRETSLASLHAQAYPRWVLAPAPAPDPGDFVVFLTAGDRLAPHALSAWAVEIARVRDADVVYADEDTVDGAGRRSAPYFKPDWSPETLLSRDYIGPAVAFRRALLERAGGPRASMGSATGYDLSLRASEAARSIVHVPDILYHRAPKPAGTADASDGERALRAALERRGEIGTPMALGPSSFAVRYAIARRERVSILLPSRDHAGDVERCLGSLFSLTTYPDFELLFIDNGTREPAALETIERWRAREPRMRVLRMDVPFNYSRLNNAAAAQATGTFLLLLNNDTEVLTPDWLEAMVEQAQRPAIGAVGANLLYPDGSVQHGGVVLGIGGLAGHVHRGAPPGAAGYFQALRTVTNYSALTGACLMVRKAVYDEAGGLDEELKVAFNDVDFCLRLRRLGYRNVWLPHVVLRHGESRSRGPDTGPAGMHRGTAEARTVRARYGAWVDDDPYYNPNLTRTDESLALRPPGLDDGAREPETSTDKQRTT
jgi:GT2 family glycosyltransferase